MNPKNIKSSKLTITLNHPTQISKKPQQPIDPGKHIKTMQIHITQIPSNNTNRPNQIEIQITCVQSN